MNYRLYERLAVLMDVIQIPVPDPPKMMCVLDIVR